MTTFRANRSRNNIRPNSARVARFGTVLVIAAGLGLASPTLVDAGGNGPAPASAAAGSIIGLREGATGDGVTAVQQKLVERGYVLAGGANGVFGSSTTRALRHFQEASGLNPTGVVTENTARLLGLTATATASAAAGVTNGAAAPAVSVTPPASPASFVGLKRGDTGEAVRRLQEKLLALQLYLSGGADGVYGASTEVAVKMVQRVNGLPETGVVTEQVASILGLTGTASSSSAPAPAGTVLQYGSRGDAVTRIQQLLGRAGITVVGGADGVFGLNTQRAVRSFQQARGLPVTGQVDAATDAALVAASATPAAATQNPAAVQYVGLRLGSTGAAVTKVQQAIIATGMFLRGGADGIFGQSTYNALVKYQQTNGLGATGVVDEATARLMGLLSAGASSGASGMASGGSTAAGYAVYDEHGARVTALQQALIGAGVAVPGGADGVFGSGTLGAVRAFQQARGLPATGKVDQATANALGLSASNASEAPAVASVALAARPVGGRCYYGDTWQAARGGGRVHLGTDIGGAEGTPLLAVVSGRVSQIYVDQPGSLSGNGIKIAMADGTYFFYAHLSAFADGIAVGTTVTAGQVIGYMGKTGNAGVSHLHFEVHPGGGSAINPYPVLKAAGGCS